LNCLLPPKYWIKSLGILFWKWKRKEFL